MTAPSIHVDVLIFGGGIAGLWSMARLMREGYSCLLLESRALGAGQTIASQGIIHGGVKYSVGGEADAGDAIAAMPAIWRDCLVGRGPVDLRSAIVLSEHQHLWTAPGLLSRIAGYGATVALRNKVERLVGDERPETLRAPGGVDVYRADEPVLDARSVIEALARSAPDRVRLYAGPERLRFQPVSSASPGHARTVEVLDPLGGAPLIRILPAFILLAAGAGNPSLMERLGRPASPVRQQLRPLHMVAARGAPGPLFAHCLAASTQPRLTITSAELGHEWAWWIGGALAEGDGVTRSPGDQIDAARGELSACLPWLDLSHLRMATSRWDRAEGVPHVQSPPQRPDGPTLVGGAPGESSAPWAVVWPTKLAFAPLVGDQVVEMVRTRVGKPAGHGVPNQDVLETLEPAEIAPRPWEAAWSPDCLGWEAVRWT